jgi:hypothetical protein
MTVTEPFTYPFTIEELCWWCYAFQCDWDSFCPDHVIKDKEFHS